MKRIKAINGYTIYQASARDVDRYNFTEGTYYIYFSSDIRDYGLSMSYPEWEDDNLECALEWCNCSNYAIAKEIVESRTTAASFEEIAMVEKQLDAGMTAEEIDDTNEDDEEIQMRKTYRITWTDIYSGETESFILSAFNADHAENIVRGRLEFYQVITHIEIILAE